jgi:hypothetical protein
VRISSGREHARSRWAWVLPLAASAAVACACGSSATGGTRTAQQANGPSPSAVAGSSSQAAATPQSGSSTAPGATTAPRNAAAVAPAAGSGTTTVTGNGRAAAPGTYSYAVSGSSPGTDTVNVVNETSSPSAASQRVTVTQQGNKVINETTWAPTLAQLTESTIQSGQYTVDCKYSSPIIEERFPLAHGLAWSSDATCTVTQGGTTATVHYTENDTISGTSTVSVDNTAVACWVINRAITITVVQGPSGPTQRSQTNSSTQVDDYAPDLGLPARTTVTSKSSSQTLTLEHLRPA